jgi:RNA polymerase-binding protein DksA
MAKKVAARMSAKDLKYFETLLLEKRAVLIEELRYIEETNMFKSQNEQGGELSSYTNHMADAASDFTTLETNFDLAEREGKYLVYLEEAIDRVRKGTYGVCKVCEELIAKPRLEAVPTATKCVMCKEETKKSEAKEQQAALAQLYLKQNAKS